MNSRTVLERADSTLAAMATGEFQALENNARVPFLFESDVIWAPAQLVELWLLVSDSSLNLTALGEMEFLVVEDDSWRRFSNSRETQAWFEKHGPRKAAMVIVPLERGRLVMVVDRDDREVFFRGLALENSP